MELKEYQKELKSSMPLWWKADTSALEADAGNGVEGQHLSAARLELSRTSNSGLPLPLAGKRSLSA